MSEPIWQQLEGYQEITGRYCTVTLEPRPSYCDRGAFLAKLWERDMPDARRPLQPHIDESDGWPRYYFDEQRAKLEIEAWLRKRKQL